MKKITVTLSALWEILKLAREDNMDFVEMDLVDAEEDGGVRNPAFVNILGVKKQSAEYIVDFGSVDEIGPEDVRV